MVQCLRNPLDKSPENTGQVLNPTSGTNQSVEAGKQVSEDPETVRERRKQKLQEVRKRLPSRVRMFADAFTGKSRKAATGAKCLDCTNLQQEEVRHCPCVDCPLHPYRPYR